MKKETFRFGTIVSLIAVCLLAACSGPTQTPEQVDFSDPHIEVVVDGLLAPIGMALMPDGGLLVAEDGTGQRDDSAGISLITAEGAVGRLISGFPSTLDSGDLAGSPLVALAPAGDKLYIGNFAQGHLWTLPLSSEERVNGFSLAEAPLNPDDLIPAMLPLHRVKVMNPFDIAFDPQGIPVVTDATGDGVAMETADGKTRFIHRFARLPDPRYDDNKITVSPVPTGIAFIDGEYWVTLTGGCPYPSGAGRLVAIDGERNERLILGGLNMPIDVAQAADGTIWVLEFATFPPDAACFTEANYQAETGRLSRLLADHSLEPVLENLNFPGSVLPLSDGSLYLTEVFPGRVLHVTFGDRPIDTSDVFPQIERQIEGETSGRLQHPDDDTALKEVIAAQRLRPNPGAEQREGETPVAELGQALFFDPILSGDKNISCGTCHHPLLAGGDGRVLPIGNGGAKVGPGRDFVERINLAAEASEPRRLEATTDPATGLASVPNPFAGQFVPRNSQTIINAALYPTQFWDSRVEQMPDGSVRTQEGEIDALGLTDPLAVQALFPLTSVHEMAGASLGDLAPQTIRTILLERLQNSPAYVEGFQAAFGEGSEATITLPRLAQAIAAFERRWIFTAAPWDSYLAGDSQALTEQQKQGALLFFGQIDPTINCAFCHSGDLFSDFRHHNILAPQLGPGKGHDYSGREDWGREGVTFDLRDRYAFRTPSLRNVELTAPYFHDGAYPTLEAVIRHHADIRTGVEDYDPTANGIPAALYSSLRPFQPEKQGYNAAPTLRNGLPLSDEDIADLLAFLAALTDPAARDISQFSPESVPSGLPLDPLPVTRPTPIQSSQSAIPSSQSPTPNPQPHALNFSNVAPEVGLNFRHGAFRTAIFEDPAAAMSAGLCWLDYDNDGWLDLYLVNSHAEEEVDYWQDHGGLLRNVLYRNEQGQFVDVSAETETDIALRGNGCLAADLNGDGWTDMFITADGPNALLWNNGDGAFSEGAAAAGLDSPEWNSAAVAGDLNGDGLLDIFVASFIDLEKKVPKPAGLFPQDYYGLPDRLFINRKAKGKGQKPIFREAAFEAGLLREERGLGALLSDFDNDGDLDLYIANDGHPNRMYANEPWPGGIEADPEGLGFRFIDLTETAQVGDAGSGMGVAGGDYDGDGFIDLLVTNWERELNALYRNETAVGGDPTFQYSTYRIGMVGLGNSQTGWGTAWADFDHDTDPDLIIVNGRVPVTNLETDRQRVRFYLNRSWNADGSQGPGGQFFDFSQQVGLKDVGPILARGSAVADYDNDGDLDIAINAIAGDVVLLQNDGVAGNWLEIDLAGMRPGARVEIELPDGRVLVSDVFAGSSYLATEDPRLHFGLGAYKSVPTLSVRWPDKQVTTIENVSANQIVKINPPAD
ncbi:MAG: ScyD/ScyE family protein [Chloroflexi bacterium]|nr:ScyD/ScyE family protein [Chloroflexota bacterium]